MTLSRWKRWRRCQKHRPGLGLARKTFVAGGFLLLLSAIVALSFFSMRLYEQSVERVWEQKYHDLEGAMLSCLNGGTPYYTLQTTDSGQQVKVYVQCEKAKEKIFL